MQNKIGFKKECLACGKLTHNVVECPRIHFVARPIDILVGNVSTGGKSMVKNGKKEYENVYMRSLRRRKREFSSEL